MLENTLGKLHDFIEQIITSLEEELHALNKIRSKEGIQNKKMIADILCKLTKMLAQLGKLEHGLSSSEAAEHFSLTEDDQRFLDYLLTKTTLPLNDYNKCKT